MAKKKAIVTNAMRMLKAAGINYETVQYEHEGEIGRDFGEEIAEKIGINPERSLKTLVLKGEKRGIVVCCIPVCAELDLKKLAKIMGDKKAEMIHVKELLGLTGYVRGGVSPIGMKKKYPVYIDESVKKHDTAAVSAGICGAALILTPQDLQKATECVFADIITCAKMSPASKAAGSISEFQWEL